MTEKISKNASNEVMQEGLTLWSVQEELGNVADLIKYCSTTGGNNSLVQCLLLLQTTCLL